MNQLRTIMRTSNWTPDRLRVLSAIVVSADHVSEAPLGRVEGVVLDEVGEIQSFIVTLWENGRAARAVLVPVSGVLWYTEGFAPAIGIAWSPELLRGQPALPPRSKVHSPSVTTLRLAPNRPRLDEAARPHPARRALSVCLFGAAAVAALAALVADPLLAVSLALLIVPVAAALGVRSGPGVAPTVPSLALPAREPWVTHLEEHLLHPEAFERRVLHFSWLHSSAPDRPTARAAPRLLVLPVASAPPPPASEATPLVTVVRRSKVG